jgi:hypothetical protein
MGRDQGPISPDRARSEDQLRGNPLISQLAVLMFSACVLLVGCTEPIYSYSKAGSDVSDFRQDSTGISRPQVGHARLARGWPRSSSQIGGLTEESRGCRVY